MTSPDPSLAKISTSVNLIDLNSGNELVVNPDGSINVDTTFPLGTIVGLNNIANAQINPATEDTLQLVKTDLDKLTFLAGSLNVNVTNGLSTGVVDESAFTYGISIEQPVGGVYQDTSPTLSAGETGSVRLTEYRAFHVNLRDSNGVEVAPATESTATSILSTLSNFNFSGGSLNVTFAQSFTATTTAISVGTSPTVLLSTNANRKGFAVQNTDKVVFIKLDSTVSTGLYSYELPKKGILEIENYCGPVTAVTASGTVNVMVTEKV